MTPNDVADIIKAARAITNMHKPLTFPTILYKRIQELRDALDEVTCIGCGRCYVGVASELCPTCEAFSKSFDLTS